MVEQTQAPQEASPATQQVSTPNVASAEQPKAQQAPAAEPVKASVAQVTSPPAQTSATTGTSQPQAQPAVSSGIQQANVDSMLKDDPLTAGLNQPVSISGVAREKEPVAQTTSVSSNSQINTPKTAVGSEAPISSEVANSQFPQTEKVAETSPAPVQEAPAAQVEQPPEPVDPLIARHMPNGDPFTNLNMFKNDDGTDKSHEEVDTLLSSVPGRFRVF